ncbi:hypothetical protein TNCV_1417921 [Trichonephila clavipes]|nr:hypothetical protein TNCV_1417921 [Trichonephila clavipes]
MTSRGREGKSAGRGRKAQNAFEKHQNAVGRKNAAFFPRSRYEKEKESASSTCKGNSRGDEAGAFTYLTSIGPPSARRVFSGTRLERITRRPRVRYFDAKFTTALSPSQTEGKGGCQLRCRPHHLTMVQNYDDCRRKPSSS